MGETPEFGSVIKKNSGVVMTSEIQYVNEEWSTWCTPRVANAQDRASLDLCKG